MTLIQKLGSSIAANKLVNWVEREGWSKPSESRSLKKPIKDLVYQTVMLLTGDESGFATTTEKSEDGTSTRSKKFKGFKGSNSSHTTTRAADVPKDRGRGFLRRSKRLSSK
jgi:hypothetical protein